MPVNGLIRTNNGGSACDLWTSPKPVIESYLTTAFLKMCAETIGAHRDEILPLPSTKNPGLRSVFLGSQSANDFVQLTGAL